MRKYLYELLSYLSVMLIGSYLTAQYRYDEPVGLYRWVSTFICFCLWVALNHYEVTKERKTKRHQISEETYQDAEAHVFSAVVKMTNQRVWQYFYIDTEGKNQHSQYFGTRKQAIEAYIVRPFDQRGPLHGDFYDQ